jgi:magnesium-transporting ATPase (P-type)
MSPAHLQVLPAVPGRLGLPRSVRVLSLAAALAGGAALAWSFGRGEAPLAWSAYLVGVFFALGLGAFGVAWLAMLYLAGADWSVTMRRIPEAMTAWLLPGGLLTLGVGLGAHSLYHWSHGDVVAGDELLLHKAPFLNMTMFTLLVGVSLLLWVAFAARLVAVSRRQDRDGGHGPTRTSRRLSAIFLVVFAVTLSIVSFYLLLSLDAHWFSTMFAVLVFTDIVQTGTAFVAVVAGLLVMAGRLKGFLNEDHLHSLGKMVFASTGFWAYIYFCQYMLIWYANIPEETVYFLRRAEQGWLPYLLLLPALKFVVPFLLLLPRDAKRNPHKLVPVAVLLLVAQFLELYVMVGPAIGHGSRAARAHVPVVEFVVTLGFTGLFTLVFGWALARREAVPLKDPALMACLEHHS